MNRGSTMTHLATCTQRALLAATAMATGCGHTAVATGPATSAATASAPVSAPLRVFLFAYVPAPAPLEARLERELTSRLGRAVEITLDPRVDAYDLDVLAQVYATHDVVELDSIFLGPIVARDLVQPLAATGRSDALPFVDASATIGGTRFGVPRWTCGFFRFGGVDARLAGDLSSAWDLAAMYLDADRDAARLTSLAERCIDRRCADGAFASSSDAVMELAGRDDVALFGYPERLAGLDPALVARLDVSPLVDETPLFFTDVLTVAQHCEGACADDAQRVIDALVDDGTYRWITLGEDRGAPRYLLPAYERPLAVLAAEEPVVARMRTWLVRGHALPNDGTVSAVVAERGNRLD